MYRRELRKKDKSKVPLKSRDWVLAKKQRLRKQGKYVDKNVVNRWINNRVVLIILQRSEARFKIHWKKKKAKILTLNYHNVH